MHLNQRMIKYYFNDNCGCFAKKKPAISRLSILYQVVNYLPNLMLACAAAKRAIGTRNGEQLT